MPPEIPDAEFSGVHYVRGAKPHQWGAFLCKRVAPWLVICHWPIEPRLEPNTTVRPMRLGVLADIHGNAVALRAVLDDASRYGVERWWALGDLVVFGPRPAEVLELLIGLPSIEFVMGNTDRHVVEGTAAFSMAGAGARGVAWTQGVLSQAGMLDWLSGLPASQTLELSRGARMLGVHASPSSDDGPGIDPDSSDEQLEELLNGCGAEVVVAGHTHLATDRMVGAIRALNPGSVGLPRRCLGAGWLVVDDKDGLTVEQHVVPFDMDAVISDLRSCSASKCRLRRIGPHWSPPGRALSRRSAHLCSWQSTRHNADRIPPRPCHGREIPEGCKPAVRAAWH